MEPATIESKLESLQLLIKEYVLKRLPDGMDADDVIQETMIFCWENPSKCSGSFLNAETCRFINEKIYEISAPDDYISETPREDLCYQMDDFLEFPVFLEKFLDRALFGYLMDDRRRFIIIEHVLNRTTFEDIATKLGITRQTAHALFWNAMYRMRTMVNLPILMESPHTAKRYSPESRIRIYKIEGRE